MKCKNPDCNETTKGDKLYCSLKCRNIYVNKYIRDYNKNRNSLKLKREKLQENYNKKPKFCKFCNRIIPFEKRRNNYCNSSCMASDTNKSKIGINRNFSKEGIDNILLSISKRFKTEEYYKNPNKCWNCNEILPFQKKHHKYCNWNCKKEYYSKISDDFQKYYQLSKFDFNLRDFEKEFDFSLVEKHGWYKAKNNGDNVNGVSRDHKFSVKEGFRRLINPLLLSHPANCELVINRHNQSKCDKCSINLEELMDDIEKFDKEYGKYLLVESVYITLEELNKLYINNIGV